MMFFRSEEYLDQWLESNHLKGGAILFLPKIWELSQSWYYNRMSPDYHGRTAEGVREIFKETGLTSEFWRVD